MPDLLACQSDLDSIELDRANRFRFPHLRDFYLFAHASLRRILSTYTQTSPRDISFGYGKNGKPFLPGHPDLHFNASHSGDLLVCVISPYGEVGVDVEHMRSLSATDLTSIPRNFFAAAEQARLAALPPAQQSRAFFECWTRKEAVIKATGEGVSRPLDSFEVAFGPDTTPTLLRLDHDLAPTWQIASLEPASGYVAAVASPHHFKIQISNFRIGD